MLSPLQTELFELFDVAAAQEVEVFKDAFGRPIPPAQIEQKGDSLLVKALADDARGVAGGDAVGRHVFRNDGICPDDGAAADMHAGQNGHVLPDPHVVFHHGVALQGQIAQGGRRFFPAAAHDIEGVGGDRAHAVVGAVHDKFHPLADGAEFADDQLVADKFVVVGDVLFKPFGAVAVVVIGVIADDDVRPRDGVFDKTDTWDIFVGEQLVRVGSLHGLSSCLLKF